MLGARGAGLAGGGVLLLWSVPPARTQLWSCVVFVLFLRLYLYTCIGQGPLGSPRGAERGLRLGTGLGGSGEAHPHGRGIALSYREAVGGGACLQPPPLPPNRAGGWGHLSFGQDRDRGGPRDRRAETWPQKGQGGRKSPGPWQRRAGACGRGGSGGLRDGAEPGWCSFTVGSMKRLG